MKQEHKQQKAIGSKTMMIKSRAYNQMKRYFIEKDDFSKLSASQKLQELENIVTETREELWQYKRKRQRKAMAQRDKQTHKVEEFLKLHPEFETIQKSDSLNGQFGALVLYADELLKATKSHV